MSSKLEGLTASVTETNTASDPALVLIRKMRAALNEYEMVAFPHYYLGSTPVVVDTPVVMDQTPVV